MGAGGRAQGLPEELVRGWPLVPWSGVRCTAGPWCPVVQAFVLSCRAHRRLRCAWLWGAAVPSVWTMGRSLRRALGQRGPGAGNRAGFGVLGKGLPGGTRWGHSGVQEAELGRGWAGWVWPGDLARQLPGEVAGWVVWGSCRLTTRAVAAWPWEGALLGAPW